MVLETAVPKTFEKEALSSVVFKNRSPDLFSKSTHCPVTFGTGIRILARGGLYDSSVFSCSVCQFFQDQSSERTQQGVHSHYFLMVLFVLEVLCQPKS